MTDIGTPTALAAFPSASSSSSSSHIKLGRVYGSDETQAVAAVQGGAVWIYDVTSHQAITSFTVPPSTVFQTTPISYHPAVSSTGEASSVVRKGKQRQRYTAVGVGKGENISHADEGKVVWIWKGEEVFEQSILKLDHRVDLLLRIPETHSMLAASSTGLTVISSQLKTTSIPIVSPKSSHLLRVFFLPRLPQTEIFVYALLFDDGSVTFTGVKGADDETCTGEDARRATKTLPAKTLAEGEQVVNAFMDDKTLVVHLLTSKGRMIPNAISLKADSMIRPGKTFIFNESVSSTSPTIASLPDTTGPVFAFATSTPSIVVLQPTYPAVLAHREISTKKLSVKELVPLTNNLVAIISTTANESGAERWMIHTVDMTVPVDGVGIAQLLDSATLTTRYLDNTSAAAPKIQDATGSHKALQSTTSRDQAFLASLRSQLFSASNGDSEPAFKVWRTWHDTEEHPFTRKRADPKRMRSRGVLAGDIVKAVMEGALPASRTDRKEKPKEGEEAGSSADSEPKWITTGAKGPYLANVITVLLENGWANDGMWGQSGLVQDGLLVVGDWDNIVLGLDKLPTVPSKSLVALLSHVAQYHISSTSVGATGLTTPPGLEDFLKLYLAIPVSPAMHKQALKRGLNQVEVVQTVLRLMVDWLEEVGKDVKSKGVVGWEADEVKSQSSRYSIEGLVLHTQLLLDAHLPLLISHPPAHSLIARLKTALEPLLTLQTELAAARGLVEGFVRLAEQKVHGSAKGKKGGAVKGKPAMGAGATGKKMFGEWMDPLYSVDEVVL